MSDKTREELERLCSELAYQVSRSAHHIAGLRQAIKEAYEEGRYDQSLQDSGITNNGWDDSTAKAFYDGIYE